MGGAALVVKGIDLKPAEIQRKAGGPDNRGDAFGGKVKRQDGMGHAVGIGADQVGGRLGREIEAVGLGIGIGCFKH